MSLLRRALGALVVLAVPIVLVALNVRLMTTAAVVRWGLHRVEAPLAIDIETRDARGTAIADYVAGRAEEDAAVRALNVAELSRVELQKKAHISSIASVVLEMGRVEDEVSHLRDVRVVIRGLQRAGALGVALVGLAALAVLRPAISARPLRASLRRGGLLTLALVALVGLGIATGWERTFVLFHRLLFPQGNWAFPADSLLIQIFPDRFWFEAATLLVSLTTVEALGLVWWGRRAPKSAPMARAGVETSSAASA